jgi:hypothetical protein
MQPLLELNQAWLAYIGNIMYEQNRQLLADIASTYGIPMNELYDRFLISKQDFYNECNSLKKS